MNRQKQQTIADHFNLQVPMITANKKAQRKTEDDKLSQYAYYLIIQHPDPFKPIVAIGQTSFTRQTRRQKIADHQASFP